VKFVTTKKSITNFFSPLSFVTVFGSGIRDPGSGKKPIPDPGSRGQKGTGSRIRIRNTGCQTVLTTHQSKRPEQDLHRSEKLGAAEAHNGTEKGLTICRFASLNFASTKKPNN